MDLGSHVPLPTYTVLGSHVPQPLAVVKPMSPEEVEKAQAAAQERVQQQVDAQKNLATQVAEQSEKAACAQITAKRDTKLLALEQVFVEEKMKLDQERVQTMAGIEQEALARQAEAVHARAVPGAPVVLSPETIAEQKTQKLELAQARCDAALAQLTARHEGLREQVALKAERKLALATSQIAAERSDRVAALDEQLEKERLAVGQHRLQQEVSLDSTTLSLPGQKAEQVQSRSEAALTQQVEAEKKLARSAAQRSETRLAAQILQQREVELMRAEQAYVQQKVALEQSRAQAVASVDQSAFLQAEQVRALQWMPGAQLPALPETQFLVRQVEAQFTESMARLNSEFEAQKAALMQNAERQEAALRAQLQTEEQQRLAALEQVKMQRSVP